MTSVFVLMAKHALHLVFLRLHIFCTLTDNSMNQRPYFSYFFNDNIRSSDYIALKSRMTIK